ncbi:putative tyrosine-protein kinase [Apostichopus japonicus]|uniref:Putative tyrosine-protein kinase n=1 Tax=Stichopus japonicus TaxID=307972 RepID=A0A2G8KCL7_STIJA|nr:putative tyrosine-protein kinase [Apostichopus japonicus]
MLLMLSNLQQRCLCLQPSSNKDVPLEDEAWYHGALPRQEWEELLKQEGDFIVRFKSDASGQYVLSCRSADKQRHFPIIKQDDSTNRLEGGSFGSIQELVNHHMSTQTPVTKASNAMIRNPISKDEHDLRHEDILLDTKLGQSIPINTVCVHSNVELVGEIRTVGTAHIRCYPAAVGNEK